MGPSTRTIIIKKDIKECIYVVALETCKIPLNELRKYLKIRTKSHDKVSLHDNMYVRTQCLYIYED
jgi:uncharacterized membrane protein